jgi:hypothetical protein
MNIGILGPHLPLGSSPAETREREREREGGQPQAAREGDQTLRGEEVLTSDLSGNGTLQSTHKTVEEIGQ